MLDLANDVRQFMDDEASHLIGEYRLDGTVLAVAVHPPPPGSTTCKCSSKLSACLTQLMQP